MTTLYDTAGNPVSVWDTSGRLVFGGTVGPGAGPVDHRPEPLDAVVAAIRPAGRTVFSATVNADGSGDFPTISAAVAAGKDEQARRVQADRLDAATPHHTIEIMVGPGHYKDTIKPPPHTAIYGAGQGRTLIESDLQSALGVIDANGRIYIEGVDLLKTTEPTDWRPKYPTHNRSNGTTVWADVGFYTYSTDMDAAPNTRASGNDGVEGGTVLFYRCRLNGRADSHGWDTQTIPQTVMFIDCESSSVVGFRSGDGGAGLAADETWVVAGSSSAVNVVGPNAVLHLDAGHTTGQISAPGYQDARTDWPIPFGGLSAAERAEHGIADGTPPENTPGY